VATAVLADELLVTGSAMSQHGFRLSHAKAASAGQGTSCFEVKAFGKIEHEIRDFNELRT
jgi:hypothetical protein